MTINNQYLKTMAIPTYNTAYTFITKKISANTTRTRSMHHLLAVDSQDIVQMRLRYLPCAKIHITR